MNVKVKIECDYKEKESMEVNAVSFGIRYIMMVSNERSKSDSNYKGQATNIIDNIQYSVVIEKFFCRKIEKGHRCSLKELLLELWTVNLCSSSGRRVLLNMFISEYFESFRIFCSDCTKSKSMVLMLVGTP